jgi:ABC-2 type transport system ATP-binding protein
VEVFSPEPDKLADVLRRDGATVSTNGPNAVLVTGASAAAVGDAALRAGIALHGLRTHQADLENVFLELTAGKAGIR